MIENSKAAHADANNDGKCYTCEYNVGTTTTNPDDTNKSSADLQSPQTGDNSMMWLWIALLFVSGFGIVTTTVDTKKRKSVK
ncbi:MAG: LPXTG cell wall anchor domain-containing protein [Acutalibacteraceae bacterium]